MTDFVDPATLPANEDSTEVDIIASGYELTCPDCDRLYNLMAVPRFAESGKGFDCDCGTTLRIGEHTHAYD